MDTTDTASIKRERASELRAAAFRCDELGLDLAGWDAAAVEMGADALRALADSYDRSQRIAQTYQAGRLPA